MDVKTRQDELSNRTVAQLKKELKEKGLPTNGKKIDLIDRLVNDEMEKTIQTQGVVIDDVEPSDSVSVAQTSDHSSSLSINTRRAQAAAKKASLQARMKLLSKKHALEEEENKLRQRKELLDVQIELESALAEENAYAQFTGQEATSGSPTDSTEHPDQPLQDGENPVAAKKVTTLLNAAASTFVPRVQVTQPTRDEVNEQSPPPPMGDLATALNLPRQEIQKFNGDVTLYHSFINTFDVRVLPYVTSDRMRLYYLDQLLIGEAKELISVCFYHEEREGYAKAREILDKEYGDVFKLSMVYLSQIEGWETLRTGDGIGLRKLSLFLNKCAFAMSTLSHLYVLNHPNNMLAVVNKLPQYLKNKWRDYASRERSKSIILQFSDLARFVSDAADVANDPVYGDVNRTREHPQSARDRVSTNRKQKTKSTASSFSTDVKESACQFCGRSHELDDCDKFAREPVENRRDFLKEKKMCFACLGTGHISKGCAKKRKCKKCGKPHPTSLHIDGFKLKPNTVIVNTPANEKVAGKKEEESIASCFVATTMHNPLVLHAIIPVRVRQEGSGKVVETYCFYDSGSSGCFMTERLMQQLDAKGTSTSLHLKTMHGANQVDSTVVSGLTVADMKDENVIKLPKVYSREEIPVSSKQMPTEQLVRKWHHLQPVLQNLPPHLPGVEVGLLLGNNCPEVHVPLDVIACRGNGPYAVRLKHGWTVQGPVAETDGLHIGCNRIEVHEDFHEVMTPSAAIRLLERDFDEAPPELPDERGMSFEDKEFIEIMNHNVHFKDGHYTAPLPFRKGKEKLPYNREGALKRAMWQKQKMIKDESYRRDYVAFVNNMIDKGYAERIPDVQHNEGDGTWYLPHHGIYHPHKPGKIRVVFDCSAKFKATSLNDCLLQGPDLTNSLMGVLSRFRKENVAFMADIESMFYQVHVTDAHRDYLRFLWWPNGEINAPIAEYRMTVHIFGAVSSPSVANYVLRLVGKSCEQRMVAQTILDNFYVDDCLKSLDGVEETKQLIGDLRETLNKGGFKLTKFSSNDLNVVSSIPKEDQCKEMLSIEPGGDELPLLRALGVCWDTKSDVFTFNIQLKEKPATRRGFLSAVSSVYDPLGFAAPVVLPAKRILQDLCRAPNAGWDDDVPEEYLKNWQKWCVQLQHLENVKVARPFHLQNTMRMETQLHVFADASSYAYGCVAYIRTSYYHRSPTVTFAAGKSRLAPLKPVTIPRLELTAAVVAVKLGCMIRKDLGGDMKIYYHTDSTTVLRYLRNEQRRYPVFVANRVRLIRDFSEVNEWHYVPSSLNPADEASRGLRPQQLEGSLWLKGPEFLLQEKEYWPKIPVQMDHEKTEEETACCTQLSGNGATDYLIEYHSSWTKLRFAIAVFLKVKQILRQRIKPTQIADRVNHSITADDLKTAEAELIKREQTRVFNLELRTLEKHMQSGQKITRPVPKSSTIYKLDPMLEEGVIRVGGRNRRLEAPYSEKHPIILPKKSHVVTLLIRNEHLQLGHAGRNHVLSSLRRNYWILGGNSTVRQALKDCTKCKRMNAFTGTQKMADLPSCRLDYTEPPFSYTGVDVFGPFTVKRIRTEIKIYGVIFTCLTSRAVHLECTTSLEADSFINVLRRFIARRGNVKELRSDNGTNFKGAHRELLKEIRNEKLERWTRNNGINWIFNPPTASHMGGAWERLIRSVRKVLTGILLEHGTRLNEDTFQTLLCEVEAILNSRPLTTVSGDEKDCEPLTPNQILTLRTSVTVPPPGIFQKADVYLRKRWKQVQFLASLFWSRWKREYLTSLQTRQKWNQPKRNLQEGDIVLIADDNTPRNNWSLGLIENAETDSNGLVRAVNVKTKNGKLRRPINKLVVLVAKES